MVLVQGRSSAAAGAAGGEGRVQVAGVEQVDTAPGGATVAMKVDRVENVVLVALVVALDNFGVELAVFDGLWAGFEKMQLHFRWNVFPFGRFLHFRRRNVFQFGRFVHFRWNVFHCK